MRKIKLCVSIIYLISFVDAIYADTSLKNMNIADSVATSSLNTPSTCFIPGADATINMNANLAKLGYEHPSSISARPIYQILIPDKSNKQQTLFFDFDPKTGSMVSTGISQ